MHTNVDANLKLVFSSTQLCTKLTLKVFMTTNLHKQSIGDPFTT